MEKIELREETQSFSLETTPVKLFCDSADVKTVLQMASQPYIKGFTTNPTLMRKAGVTDYATFAQQLLERITDRPVSFEVLSDEFDEMERQAQLISSWGTNIYVKIPVTNTKGAPSYHLVERLAQSGVKVNVTAVFTLAHVRKLCAALRGGADSIVSIFAGRIADAGIDPVPVMAEARNILDMACPNAELLWASPREVLNLVQAEQARCDIITATQDILNKLHLLNKDLDEFSLETVQMFYRDALAAGYEL